MASERDVRRVAGNDHYVTFSEADPMFFYVFLRFFAFFHVFLRFFTGRPSERGPMAAVPAL